MFYSDIQKMQKVYHGSFESKRYRDWFEYQTDKRYLGKRLYAYSDR